MDEARVVAVATRFHTGKPLGASLLKGGHIHDTWLVRVSAPQGSRSFVQQRLNRAVFPRPDRVMENIERVTTHVRGRLLAAGHAPERHALAVVPALDGRPFCVDDQGETWRSYHFIEGARSFGVVQGPRHAYETGRAFGRFLALLGDLPAPPLHETIHAFADTRARFGAFARALDADRAGRAVRVGREIELAREREALAGMLSDAVRRGDVPLRTAHHDTKIDNVLIDDETGEGLCVLDLDTVMPGTALYDFGDMVRYGACRAAEDDLDLSRARIDLELFEHLARGWLDATRELLVPDEVERLVEAGRCLTLVAGLRFLTDFLDGDAYFRTTRPDQNLDRCRVQLALVRDMESRAEAMHEIVRRHARRA